MEGLHRSAARGHFEIVQILRPQRGRQMGLNSIELHGFLEMAPRG